jgi:hypothetical protein
MCILHHINVCEDDALPHLFIIHTMYTLLLHMLLISVLPS